MADYDQVILEHYKEVALKDKDAATSTMADLQARRLETNLIQQALAYALEHAGSGHAFQVVDAGCGNGYTLDVLRQKHADLNYIGFEYTPQLRDIAQKRFAGNSGVTVFSGDIRDRSTLSVSSVDFLICQRVLINLLDIKDQEKALKNLVGLVRSGGFLLFIEAFETGLNNLNAVRREFDLAPIPPAHHNLNLKEDFFKCAPQLKRVKSEAVPFNFMSTHHFVARVLHPLLLGNKPFARNSLFVSFCSEALKPNVGDFSALRAFFFQKTSGVN